MPRWWLRASISVIVAAILLTFVPLGEVWNAIRTVSPWVWVTSVVIFTGGHVCNALKLRVLLGPGTTAACVRAHFSGMAANLGLPGVAGGEVVRVASLAPGAGTARAATAAIVDRLVDAVVLLGLVLTAASVAGLPLPVGGSERSGMRRLVVVAAVIVLAVLASRRWLRGTRATRVRATLRDAWSSIAARPHAIGAAALISVSVQCVFVLTNVWLASEVGVGIGVAPWFLAWTGSKLSALLPISLGGIGVRDATLVSILAAYGAPADTTLAVGILWEGAIVAGTIGGFLLTQLLRK